MDVPQKKKRFSSEWDQEMCAEQRREHFYNQQSTAPVQGIPLPPERDWMADPETVSSFSGSLVRSTRIVVKAEEAEIYMLNKARSSLENVRTNFRSRVLDVVKAKRELQVNVPYVDFPCHSPNGRQSISTKSHENDEPVSADSLDSNTESESSDDENITAELEGGTSRGTTREEQRKEKKKLAIMMNMAAKRKKTHPNRLHPEINYNEKNLRNDGPECRCPPSIQNEGLKHGFYAGEDKVLDCGKTDLHYYTLRVHPAPNNAQIFKTQWNIQRNIYTFEGFSLITHAPLPQCMTRRPISSHLMDYEFQLVEENMPEGCFAPNVCDDLYEYIFHEIFEMFNFQLRPKHVPADVKTCPVIHIMPRFECFKDGVVYLWSSKTVLAYFLYKKDAALFELNYHCRQTGEDFSRTIAYLKQSIILDPQYKPSAVRADSFEKDEREMYFVHNAWIKYSHRPTEHQTEKTLKLREPVRGYIDTGLKPDVVAHVAMTILACHHVRYNFSISAFEETIGYQFNDRSIIELAFKHSSFTTNFGTPMDHIKNMVTNCGYRRRYLRDEEKQKSRGLENLHNSMRGEVDGDPGLDNERLEFLGDSVVELIVSHHLFFMLPHHLEGGLATYRASLVQNRNLAKLAKNLRIDELLQFAHGANLINVPDFKHALANSFEAMMGAVYLDGGLGACDAIFSRAMYGSDPELKKIWDHNNEHELVADRPMGDRELIGVTPALAIFQNLENQIGYKFKNICLLAKAFTRREIPFNEITKGHNQRLEWLGDSVLQLQISDFLYKNYPNHREGHMSLLRSSLVCNPTLALVFDDLGFHQFVVRHPLKDSMKLKVKDKADIVEAFIGALYVDSGIEHCKAFVRTVICPRIQHCIQSEKWNDPKSHLQNWCLANQESLNGNKALPEYRLLGTEGSSDTRTYRVGVFFKGERLATGASTTVHSAEFKAAENALSAMEASERGGRKQTRRRRPNRIPSN